MSGTLGTLLDGLFTASFRGVEFHIPDARHEAGRRVARFLFPGVDAPIHEDLGVLPGVIDITGLILGDDHVRRARALEAAFNTAGPGTLVHPWLGEIQVVLVGPATITFSERELRAARFDATFERWGGRRKPKLDTLGRLLAAIDEARAGARSLLRRVLAPVRQTLAGLAAISGAIGSVATVWRGVVAGVRGGGLIRGALAGPIEALSGFAINLGAADPGGDAADAMDRPARAALAAGIAAPPAAIGPGPEAAAAQGDARATARLLLDVAAGLAAEAVGGSDVAAVVPLAAAEALALAAAAEAVIDIPFESSDEARAWRAALDAGLAAAEARAAGLGAAEPEGAAALLRSLAALRAAAAADLDERIGRLPQVVRLAIPPAGLPAWLAAQHLAGDDPAGVVAQLLDLVARNRLRHPALVPGGAALEALRPR